MKSTAFVLFLFLQAGIVLAADPAEYVNPFIGTANGGNTFPGAVVPFGMVQWSPEEPFPEKPGEPVTAGGYLHQSDVVRGFSLTHLSGTGCRGASGDIPFMPYVGKIDTSPSSDTQNEIYRAVFSHVNEKANPGYYQVRLFSGIKVELTATTRTGSARFTYPKNQPAVLLIRTSDSELGSSDAHVNI